MRNVLLAALAFVAAPASANITVVDFNSLDTLFSTTFSDTTAGVKDSFVYSRGIQFGEHFNGQTVSLVNNSDVISGTPTGLTLLNGPPSQNLQILGNPGNTLIGLGPVTPPPGFTATGAVSMLFNNDQSQIGIGYIGSNPGGYNINFSFFRADGSVIQTITLPSNVSGINDGAQVNYGFKSDTSDIRGISIWNNDLGGIGFTIVTHDVISTLAGVPEPATWAMLLLGFGVIGLSARRQSRLRVASSLQ